MLHIYRCEDVVSNTSFVQTSDWPPCVIGLHVPSFVKPVMLMRRPLTLNSVQSLVYTDPATTVGCSNPRGGRLAEV